jgi:hypothetical protein
LSDIDRPNLKQTLWEKMRADLSRYYAKLDGDRLFCPTCFRLLPLEDFSIEHIIPQQSLADDPREAREALPKNTRTYTTLLCTKRLVIRGKTAYDNGCNSWKGKHFDGFLREIFNARAIRKHNFSSRHQISLFASGYLGLFSEYGYQIALMPSGGLCRRQFFSPDKFLPSVPLKCHMVMAGDPDLRFDESTAKYWSPPFKFTFEESTCLVVVRNVGFNIPCSRDPNVPLAYHLSYAPPRFSFRPNFETMFD